MGSVACSRCEDSNPRGQRFCGHCGASLFERPQAEERRWVTVLFADLSGFGTFAEGMDPEEVRTVVDRCLTAFGEVVERFDGRVFQAIGDEILAVFGAPVAHADDPERAVRAALAMRDMVVSDTATFAGLSVRIGVNSGETMVAPLGTGAARMPTVTGDSVNVAKRLQGLGEPGSVIVGAETAAATERTVAYDDLGSVEVKGKRQIGALRALGLLPVPVARSPFVGRREELAALLGRWREARAEQRATLATVLAPPGMGKSRIGAELARRVAAEGGRVLVGRCLPYGEGTGYGAFVQQLSAAAGIDPTEPIAAAQAKLRDLTRSLVGPADGDRLAAQLMILGGLDVEGPRMDREILYLAAQRIVGALARREPLLLVFEDLHWADRSLLALLEVLLRRVEGAPVLLLGLARPELVEHHPEWAQAANATTLPLAPLTDAESAELAGELLGTDAQDESLRRLVDVGGGNPLFIEELTAVLGADAGDRQIPGTVQGIIGARLDLLPAAARRLLLDAAVAGQVFSRGMLAALDHAELDTALAELERRDLVRPDPSVRVPGAGPYNFKHALVRDVAYGLVPRARRRERHGLLARVIEGLAGERTAELSSLLAHHWREAGERLRARDHLVVAADRATRAWAKEEAIALYTQALELTPAEDEQTRASLRLERGVARWGMGDLAAAAEEMDGALLELSGAGLLSGLIQRGAVAFNQMDAARCQQVAEQAMALADELGDPTLRPAAQALLGHADTLRGQAASAIETMHGALRDWPAEALPVHRALAVEQIGLCSYWLGRYPDAIEYSRRSRTMGYQVFNPPVVLRAGACEAMALAGLGQHARALEQFEAVVAEGREIELRLHWTVRAVNAWGGTLREVGRLDAARARNREGVELALAAGFPFGRLQGAIDLITCDLDAGEVGAADAAWQSTWDGVAELQGWHAWLMVGRLRLARARILLGRDDAGAVDAAHEALRHATDTERLKYQAASRTVLAHALRRAGRPSEGREQARLADTAARRLAHPPSRWEAAAALRDLSHDLGEDDDATAADAEVRKAVGDLVGTLPGALAGDLQRHLADRGVLRA